MYHRAVPELLRISYLAFSLPLRVRKIQHHVLRWRLPPLTLAVYLFIPILPMPSLIPCDIRGSFVLM
jgi:hypothetical protein